MDDTSEVTHSDFYRPPGEHEHTWRGSLRDTLAGENLGSTCGAGERARGENRPHSAA